MVEEELESFKILRFKKLPPESGISCCFTTKFFGGQPVWDMRKENISAKKPLFRKFIRAAGAERYFYMGQSHTANVAVIEKNSPVFSPDTDACCTSIPGAALLGFSADCSLTLFYDSRNMVIGICHAGWLGALANVYQALFRKMKLAFGTRPSDLFVGVGPCISWPNYQVGEELIERFHSVYGRTASRFYKRQGGKYFFDIVSVLEYQLEKLEIADREFSGLCTYSRSDILYSHRRGDDGRFAICAIIKNRFSTEP